MALLEAVVGATKEALEKAKKNKQEQQEEKEASVNYIVEILVDVLNNKDSSLIEKKIAMAYDRRKDDFDSLNEAAEKLINFITAGDYLVASGKMTVEDLKSAIRNNKKKIENILGIEIKLIESVEKFLKRDN